MTSRARLFSALVLVCLLAAGCARNGPGPELGGSGGPEDAPAAPPPELLTLLPADTFAVLRVDLAQTRESPYYDLVVAMIRGVLEGEQEVPVDLLDILGRSDELVVAMMWRQGAGDPGMYFMLRGRYEDGELGRVLGALAERWAEEAQEGTSQPRPVVPIDLQGHRVYAVEDLVLTALGGHTWILTEPDLVELPLARAGGVDSTPGPRADETFAALARACSFDQAPMALVVVATEAVRAELMEEAGGERSGGGRMLTAIIEALVGAGVRADLSQGIRLEGIVETTNALVAAATADFIEASLAEMIAEPPLAELLSPPEIRIEDTRALITLSASDEQVRRVFASAETLDDFVDALEGRPPSQPDPPEREQAEPPADQEPEAPPEQ